MAISIAIDLSLAFFKTSPADLSHFCITERSADFKRVSGGWHVVCLIISLVSQTRLARDNLT